MGNKGEQLNSRLAERAARRKINNEPLSKCCYAEVKWVNFQVKRICTNCNQPCEWN